MACFYFRLNKNRKFNSSNVDQFTKTKGCTVTDNTIEEEYTDKLHVIYSQSVSQ